MAQGQQHLPEALCLRSQSGGVLLQGLVQSLGELPGEIPGFPTRLPRSKGGKKPLEGAVKDRPEEGAPGRRISGRPLPEQVIIRPEARGKRRGFPPGPLGERGKALKAKGSREGTGEMSCRENPGRRFGRKGVLRGLRKRKTPEEGRMVGDEAGNLFTKKADPLPSLFSGLFSTGKKAAHRELTNVAAGKHHHRPVHRPGQGHIEKPHHFFRAPLCLLAPPVFAILFLPWQPLGKDHDRELKPLGPVDGQDANPAIEGVESGSR